MIPKNSQGRIRAIVPVLLFITTFLLLTAGCTQQDGAQAGGQNKFAEVSATQPDTSHIVITYKGGENMMKILELETTVTDSTGKSQTRSIGSRLATTPITISGTNTITGPFDGKDQVMVTGYFTDGSHRVLLDTTI
jgi:hypothetical protein